MLVLWSAGKGIQIWKRQCVRYDGDWYEGKRHGFGMYSILNEHGEQVKKEYSGGWKHDKKHVCMYYSHIPYK